MFGAQPAWVFELAGLPSVGKCAMRSLTVKTLERRSDGVIVPQRREPPLSVVEFQFGENPQIYTRTKPWAGDAPVIVVINKCDGQHRNLLQIDQTRLQQDWPSIVGFVRTSCDPGDEPAAMIQSLRETIVGALNDDRRLKHVRDPVPQAWLTVKENMAQLAQQRQVLDIVDFQRLCNEATTLISNSTRPAARRE